MVAGLVEALAPEAACYSRLGVGVKGRVEVGLLEQLASEVGLASSPPHEVLHGDHEPNMSTLELVVPVLELVVPVLELDAELRRVLAAAQLSQVAPLAAARLSLAGDSRIQVEAVAPSQPARDRRQW
jgi:hypothetical protein